MKTNFKINSNALGILKTLHENGHEAFIVGGAVRDHLLGMTPKDYDIVTDAHPEQVKKVFGRSARIIGRRFKLVHVRRGQECYEVSTFRRKPDPHERRAREDDDGVTLWRDNEYGSREEDAFRRDFTVNSLMYDPFAKEKLVDYTGGLQDMENGVVRAIGDPELRLAEDPVRILRALKLVAQYDFTLAPDLEEVLRQRVETIHEASRSRLFEELMKIFAKPYSAKTFDTFAKYGFLDQYLPNLAAVWGKGASGKLMRDLMQERDRRKQEGTYWLSRRLALATLTLPAVVKKLTGNDEFDWWEYEHGTEKTARHEICQLLEPLPTPKALSHNAKDVILLLPRFDQEGHRKRLLHDHQYRWARELFSILLTVMGWDKTILEKWPVDNGQRPPKRRNRGRPRQKHVKRSHKKEWNETQ
jgi:poly(A) polymerase